MAQETVAISAARLQQLEALEATLPTLIAQAKAEAVAADKKARLSTLHESSKESQGQRALKSYHKNKEEINAKRRAAYQAKKAAAAATTDKTPGVSFDGP